MITSRPTFAWISAAQWGLKKGKDWGHLNVVPQMKTLW